MGTRVLLLLVLPALVAAVIAALTARSRPVLGADAEVDTAVRALASAQRRAAWLALPAAVAFGAGAVLLLGDRAVYVALPGAIAVLGAGRLLAERFAPAAPPAAVRTAVLERRERGHYVTGRRVLLMRGSALAAAVVGIGTVLAAAPDGRSFDYVCSAFLSGSSSPWPGSRYAVPGLVVLLVTVVLAEVTLRRVVLRPRPSASAAQVLDDGLRAASARACVRSGTAVGLLLLAGFSLPAGADLRSACGTPLQEGLGGLLLVLAGVGALLLLALAVDTGRAAGERTAGRVASTPVGTSPR